MRHIHTQTKRLPPIGFSLPRRVKSAAKVEGMNTVARSTFKVDDLGTLGCPSPPSSRRRARHWARRLERRCCQTLAYFPLLFIYGLTTWAVWVEIQVSFLDSSGSRASAVWNPVKAALGVGLWAMANLCYSIAVFTSPASPVDRPRDAARGGKGRKGGEYEGLPTSEDAVTAKSTGKPRYCNKCHTIKPDRTHHCSTCGRCVLKMDHHCPWLATCVGLRNYKPFLLFLIYTTLFCYLCFATTATWVWAEIVSNTQMREDLIVVNIILLAVLSATIGLVLSGFTGWHIYLTLTGQTTIESLEKTRYLNPLRNNIEARPQRNYLQQPHPGLGDSDSDEEQTIIEHLKEIHANALPSVLRPEEGEVSGTSSRAHTPIPPYPMHASTSSLASGSPAKDSLQRSYASLEEQREKERYSAYLDELDSEKLPNAFDLGWRRNFVHVFGDSRLFWILPLCNTSGDGWAWEVSPKWQEARDRVARERAARTREDAHWDRVDGETVRSFEPPPRREQWRWRGGQGFVNQARNARPPPRRSPQKDSDADMQMRPLDRRREGPALRGESDVDSYESNSDEDVRRVCSHSQIAGTTGDWNDVPDEFLPLRRGTGAGAGHRSRSRGRRKGD